MHGAFSASDVLRTASAVGYYGSGLVFIGGFMVLSRISYSAHDPWGPSIATVIASLVYIPAAINLRHQMGVPGLALAYSLSMAVACIALGIRIGVKGREKLRFRDASEFVRIVLAGGAMACCIWLFRLSLGGSRWAGLNGILELCAVLLTGSLAYVIACGLLGSETLRHAFGYLRRRPD